ncbi:MAG TPA: rRNA maturation RNase YbeY [Vicinamibacterales bacterium]
MTDGADSRGLHVVLTDESGRPVRARALAVWLGGVAPARARGLVTIALIDDATMQRLNRRYVGKDRATDVLSFPAETPGRRGLATRQTFATARRDFSPAHPHVLGDIAIATGVARRQARVAGHSYGQELRLLALHGLLHLLGYDHHTDDGAMARLESRLRRKGGLTIGLIERVRRA